MTTPATARCRRPECGRPLRTEESVARGYGPVCWQRIHPGVAARPAGELDPDQIPLPLEATVDAQKYRKKPVTVEAVQWYTHGDHPKVNEYRSDHPAYKDTLRCCARTTAEHGWVSTLEGGHIVCPSDWIITGVKGEHYPCKDDIFRMTYEPVED